MKLKTEDKVKPWENIPIDEILPYNPKYTKMIVLSYIFVAFFMFANMGFLDIHGNYLLLVKICIYGTLAFMLLYLFEDGNSKRMLNTFISMMLFFGVVGLIVNGIILAIITGFNFLDVVFNLLDISAILSFVLILLDFIFIGITIVLGPISLMVSHHPKLEKHALLIAFIFNIFIISKILSL